MQVQSEIITLSNTGFQGTCSEWWHALALEGVKRNSVWGALQSLCARGLLSRTGRGPDAIYVRHRTQEAKKA